MRKEQRDLTSNRNARTTTLEMFERREFQVRVDGDPSVYIGTRKKEVALTGGLFATVYATGSERPGGICAWEAGVFVVEMWLAGM